MSYVTDRRILLALSFLDYRNYNKFSTLIVWLNFQITCRIQKTEVSQKVSMSWEEKKTLPNLEHHFSEDIWNSSSKMSALLFVTKLR